MKIAVDLDSMGNLDAVTFDNALTKFDTIADVKFVCTGLRGRVGDKYEPFRNREDVLFSEGLPLNIFFGRIGWSPDVVYKVPRDPENSFYFHKPEVMI